MRVAILDGFVDEPSCLGVPPYISPYPRYAAGAVIDAGHEYIYLTIDDVRENGEKCEALKGAEALAVISGPVVPGKYIRTMPASERELVEIARHFSGTRILGGPLARFGTPSKDIQEAFDFICEKDLSACLFDALTEGKLDSRRHTQEERAKWAVEGATVVSQRLDFPETLIAELELYSGCVRYASGGCSFCTEPLYGKPEFIPIDVVASEVAALSRQGVRHFRLGGSSCIFSYMARGVGKRDNPEPDPDAVEGLFQAIHAAAPDLVTLHTDNANPAMIALYPEAAEKILQSIVRHCTSGNLLSLGVESVDSAVIEKNNLNSTPEQVLSAVRLINKVGSDVGKTGLPKLLPGLNFLSGLPGESAKTFDSNFQFLKGILDEGLMLRRINLRQAAPVRPGFLTKRDRKHFQRFKRRVREEIDAHMLPRVAATGTVLSRVYLELKDGKNTFGRQIGTYPLLVGIPYEVPLGTFVDVKITGHGFRSITGVVWPMDVNTASLKALEAVPGIGKKRAARVVMARPFADMDAFCGSLDGDADMEEILNFVGLGEGRNGN